MLMITSFTNPRVAQAFVDYMQTQGVILTIQHHSQSDIWLADESQAERVKAELARFLENPTDPRYLAASWQSGETGSGLHYRGFSLRTALRERGGPITLSVFAACVLVFILMSMSDDQTVMVWLAWPYDASLKFEAWRYFSHALMHFSLVHIIFNLFWWWYLGGAVEKRLGSGKLVVITLISALLSGFLQYKLTGPWFGGLSGVVYALIGYVWLRGERDPERPVWLPRGLVIFTVVLLVADWFGISAVDTAIGAHTGGLVIGLAMALVDTLNARKRT
ncbi:rhomboid family intramembrane serine protease GlpG [Citrobacter braakii]|uniref:Rhomboid family intramembrane serine protease GlpG n=2 Tax=Enterobacteriaceae TaxID=543 RepID=A0A7T0E0G5_9ENTR|nr:MULTISPECIES: rhomboid family intramembrane serine protease GlpG [Enterobacteriaceae]HED1422564.1 rhomboid family intramembrane serine protease GlpG [Kluyvera georgiana]MBV7162422.1 rhomboid family intramembrane serine protease GlpG [Escherichia coli]MBY6254354.1 rhomboid family intramembrane serine protease GlpG [Citrobacter werkmanii]MDH0771436.1 rhomboid family intramembrane serine protease GlpG [Citrobacter freundii]MDH1812403.1 rhomboid family intramembrane serine protease GlpG [Citrob